MPEERKNLVEFPSNNPEQQGSLNASEIRLQTEGKMDALREQMEEEQNQARANVEQVLHQKTEQAQPRAEGAAAPLPTNEEQKKLLTDVLLGNKKPDQWHDLMNMANEYEEP